MPILLRFLWVVIAGLRLPRLGVTDLSRLDLWVWPLDLDINWHMNNARYLAVMDLGRADWIIRSGAWRLIKDQGMAPVVGGAMVRYRRSLRLFERFELRTRLLGWDERWLYVEQVMQAANGVACLAVQRTAFTRAGRVVPPDELASLIGYPGPPRPAPDWVAAWSGNEALFAAAAQAE